MKKLALIALVLMSACAKNNVLGASESACEKNPEQCLSTRDAYENSNGPISPRPSQAALQRGDAMRVWVAPMRTANGVLTNSGHVYLE